MANPLRWGYIRRAKIIINSYKNSAALTQSIRERSEHLERAAKHQRALDRVEAMTDEAFQTETLNNSEFYVQLLS